jgi:hypothetical protein
MRRRRQYHPVLTNRELAKSHAQRQQAKRDAMGPQEISFLMRRTAEEALDRNGTVEEADFVRANVPAHAIQSRGKAIISEVVGARSRRGVDTSQVPVLAMNWDRSMQ